MVRSGSFDKIAFLGLGLMGQPMALRLVEAGHRLTVWNRTLSKADGLAASGAAVATSVADAVRDADVVVSMLENGAVVTDLARAAVAAMHPGALWVDMSSTQQQEAQHLHALLASHGVGFVDAPVSGGVQGAITGTLAIMAGGSDADFARVAPILTVLGRPTLVGPAGCGQLAKLCNQLIVGASLNIVAEALLLAQAGGADPAAVRAAIRGGFAESRILDVHGQRMLERNFWPGGQVKSQAKDMENVLIAAQAANLRLPLAQLAAEQYRSIVRQHPHADQSAALLALEALNPGQRLGQTDDRLPP
jgi:3-hydroxyisobutyrate dehydrogenase-like beta-hydroxyacid dehydrogenase